MLVMFILESLAAFILEIMGKHCSCLYLGLWEKIGHFYTWDYAKMLVTFIIESVGKHWLCLYLRLYENIDHIYTWVYRKSLVAFILEFIGTYWSHLYMGHIYSSDWKHPPRRRGALSACRECSHYILGWSLWLN